MRQPIIAAIYQRQALCYEALWGGVETSAHSRFPQGWVGLNARPDVWSTALSTLALMIDFFDHKLVFWSKAYKE
jgi:hypothetical protein